MALKRTGRVQTERTETGIITTAEEKGHVKGQKRTRWVQIGYTSIVRNSDDKEVVDGIYGKALAQALDPETVYSGF